MTKVLVVDDSALMRKLLGRIFSKEADFEVQFARNGLEALELLAAFRPDVVTLDIHMPQMDGLACLDRIMIERPCPVVMVSSLTAEGADVTLQALRLGAIDFVAKPEGAISLHIDDLTDELINKVRAASTARIRSSARLKERVRHRIGRDSPGIRLKEGHPEHGRRDGREPRRAAGEGLVLVGTSTGGPPALEALLSAKRLQRETQFHELLATLATNAGAANVPVVKPFTPRMELFDSGKKHSPRIAVVGMPANQNDLLLAEVKSAGLHAVLRFPDGKDKETVSHCDYAIIIRKGASAEADRAIGQLGRSRVTLIDSHEVPVVVQQIRNLTTRQ